MDWSVALEHYENMQDVALKHINAQVKSKGILKGDMVLRYNSKLDKTFQKKFQVKWEGPSMVENFFDNGTYQLADLDGTLHVSRVNGLRLKKYFPRLMSVVKDDVSQMEVVAQTGVVYQDTSLTTLFSADHE